MYFAHPDLPVDVCTQYQALLRVILEQGEWSATRQGPRTKSFLGATLRYNLATCFPMITERDIGGFWRLAINELLAFINGARTLVELEKFGCTWWGPWASESKCSKRGLETGDIGPGSYGHVFADYPGPNGEGFDQWSALVDQIKYHPEVKTHVITNWLAGHLTRAYNHQPTATIAPCHGNVQVTILEGKLHLEMVQRSGDVPIGVPSNMVQYAAIQLALCHLTGYEPGTYIHHIRNAHVYEDQIDKAEELAYNRPALDLPTMVYIGTAETIRHVRSCDFMLSDYAPHPAMRGIPVAT